MAIKKINHVAIAVTDLEESIHYYQDIMGLELLEIEEIEYLHVRVAIFACGDTKIELVYGTSEESAASRFIQDHGPGLYHIAFEVDDVYKTVEECAAKGIEPRDPAPKPGAGGSTVCFLKPKHTFGVITELVQPPKDGEHCH